MDSPIKAVIDFYDYMPENTKIEIEMKPTLLEVYVYNFKVPGRSGKIKKVDGYHMMRPYHDGVDLGQLIYDSITDILKDCKKYNYG
jgi:hypothetical protein